MNTRRGPPRPADSSGSALLISIGVEANRAATEETTSEARVLYLLWRQPTAAGSNDLREFCYRASQSHAPCGLSSGQLP